MYLGARIPVLGFCAASGTGKTTLLKQLLTLFPEDPNVIAVACDAPFPDPLICPCCKSTIPRQ